MWELESGHRSTSHCFFTSALNYNIIKLNMRKHAYNTNLKVWMYMEVLRYENVNDDVMNITFRIIWHSNIISIPTFISTATIKPLPKRSPVEMPKVLIYQNH